MSYIINQSDDLNDFNISIDEYDITTLEINNDPDFEKLDEIMNEIKKEL